MNTSPRLRSAPRDQRDDGHAGGASAAKRVGLLIQVCPKQCLAQVATRRCASARKILEYCFDEPKTLNP